MSTSNRREFLKTSSAGAAGLAYVIWDVSRDLPDYKQLAQYEPPVMTRIHAADGSLLAEYAEQRLATIRCAVGQNDFAVHYDEHPVAFITLAEYDFALLRPHFDHRRPQRGCRFHI